MKTSDLKQTAFVGIVATAALGVGTTFTQTTASADSLETPVVMQVLIKTQQLMLNQQTSQKQMQT